MEQKQLLAAKDVKVFVPSRDFHLSLSFYEKLGWKKNWVHEESLAEMELGGVRFYLQNYYHREWASNFMLYIDVENTEAWYDHAKAIIAEGIFGVAKIRPPKLESHAKVTYVWDPCGVLLHFAESV